jgi:ATP synthase protein I
MSDKEPRFKPIIEGAETLSLGVSVVVAILIGVAIGFGLSHLFHTPWLLWIGVALGIAAAILNIYKVSSKQYKEFEKMAQQPKYKVKKHLNEDDEDEDDYASKQY